MGLGRADGAPHPSRALSRGDDDIHPAAQRPTPDLGVLLPAPQDQARPHAVRADPLAVDRLPRLARPAPRELVLAGGLPHRPCDPRLGLAQLRHRVLGELAHRVPGEDLLPDGEAHGRPGLVGDDRRYRVRVPDRVLRGARGDTALAFHDHDRGRDPAVGELPDPRVRVEGPARGRRAGASAPARRRAQQRLAHRHDVRDVDDVLLPVVALRDPAHLRVARSACRHR